MGSNEDDPMVISDDEQKEKLVLVERGMCTYYSERDRDVA